MQNLKGEKMEKKKKGVKTNVRVYDSLFCVKGNIAESKQRGKQ